ncbi:MULTISPECIES: N-acetylmuramidase domain-containing protein [unclassified Aminobacter]|uniref:N-acetylmuramidase domain-containing protein n=1 Tax=unclassified Aminobacter TaxID=2644704 RepID=UPI000463B9C8|nr:MULTISPECIES: N-acetylmuramidase domain-containing protein [unclassified Aminobacter]TWH25864.1 uncharacterized protein DUF3380 [Aminobacter sp. J15]
MLNETKRLTIAEVARTLKVEPAALAAVVEVESGGRIQALVEGRPEPLIRFEGHYFDRRLAGDGREGARKQGLAAPQAGVIRNPASQAARWQMLRQAAEIDRKAAYESTSWGVGQVMGAHDWAAFARGYNGPAYRRNRYDTKLAAAYAIYQKVSFDLGLNAGAETRTARTRGPADLFDSTIRFFAALFGRRS